MLWEVIRKNKIKSVIALIVTAVWYLFIYGIIGFLIAIIGHAYLIYLIGHEYNISQTNFRLSFTIGALIALYVFISSFLHQINKPYKLQNCYIYPCGKKSNKMLYNIVEEIAIASGQSFLPKIYIADSYILNAYSCGIPPKNSSIVISKALLGYLSRDELQGVIAHEMSHIINRDTMYLLCSGLFFNISYAITNFFIPNKETQRFNPILAFISFLGQCICFLLFMFVSRKREYIADACAALYTRYPKGLADALLKIEKFPSINNIYKDIGADANYLVKASFIAPCEKNYDSIMSTHPSIENRIKILLNMTSAGFREYEKEYRKLCNKKLLPESALKDKKVIPIKKTENKPDISFKTLQACSLGGIIDNKEQIKTLRENKALLKENIKKHREIEDLVRNLAEYKEINCDCGTKLKIPPVYKNQIIICPHCGKKHTI